MKRSGFTLVELMLVLAIVAILAALIIPMIGKDDVNSIIRQQSINTGIEDRTSKQSRNNKLKLTGETDRVKIYEYVTDDHRRCIMIESKYTGEETTMECN